MICLLAKNIKFHIFVDRSLKHEFNNFNKFKLETWILWLLRGVFPYFLKLRKFSQARNFWWVILNLMKLIYLKSALKCDSFDVAICTKIPFFFYFWLLLSRVAPYYSSLPRTVWFQPSWKLNRTISPELFHI